MNKIVALVLTFNRKVLLQECLESLLQQSCDCDILVVDNASTDGTKEMVLEVKEKTDNNINFAYINTGKNLGGAGGFSFGMKIAVKMGYEYIWLMDDDTIPYKDSLEKLVEVKDEMNGNFGFLSSMVEWTDGNMCIMNKPLVAENWWECGSSLEHGKLAISKGSFVSFFVSAETIKKVGLPLKEFFIWFDDSEYSRRIVENIGNGYLVFDSKVLHKMNSNSCVDIVTENGDRLGRYNYAFRNRYYLCKKHGLKAHLKYDVYFWKTVLHIILKSKDKKLKRIGIMIKSTFNGYFFNPSIDYPDDAK